MNEMNEFAKHNDLARKFEAAIQTIDNGKGWMVFEGLDKGETTVKVVYDGEVRFLAVKPKKVPRPRTKKVKPKRESPDTTPENTSVEPIFSYEGDPSQGVMECPHCGFKALTHVGDIIPTECPKCNKPLFSSNTAGYENVSIDVSAMNADFLCLKCGGPGTFQDERCKKCGQRFPPPHGAMYMPLEHWPREGEDETAWIKRLDGDQTPKEKEE